MSDPRLSQNAARLSEDIGDVLSAIRRLIAEDEALTSARGTAPETAIDEDAGDFLARRYGGNAALARRLVGSNETGEGVYRRPSRLADAVAAEVEDGEDSWPLGGLANGADAARPQPRIMRHQIVQAEAASRPSPAQNDLARQLSAALRQEAAPEPRPDWPGDILRAGDDRVAGRASAEASAPTAQPAAPRDAVAPLRLDAARRVVNASEPSPSPASAPNPGGWRGWIRPEPPLQRRAAPAAAPVAAAPSPAPAPIIATPASVAMRDDEDDFAEAFDWKARMRPEATTDAAQSQEAAPAATAPAPKGARRSGWAAEAPVLSESEATDFAQVLDSLEASAPLPATPRREAAAPAPRTQTTAEARIEAAVAPGAPRAAEADLRPAAESRLEAAPVQPTARDIEAAAQSADHVRPATVASASHDTVTGLPPEVEEKCIRDLLREMIQEELHGELGERFSRNLRAVIRREVAAAIDDHLERF